MSDLYYLFYLYHKWYVEDDIPTMRDINRYVTREFAADWKNVGIELGLTTGMLKIIAKDHPQQAEDCFREVLDNWLQCNPTATWKMLEVALTNVKRQQLSGIDPVNDVYGKDTVKLSLFYEHKCWGRGGGGFEAPKTPIYASD